MLRDITICGNIKFYVDWQSLLVKPFNPLAPKSFFKIFWKETRLQTEEMRTVIVCCVPVGVWKYQSVVSNGSDWIGGALVGGQNDRKVKQCKRDA